MQKPLRQLRRFLPVANFSFVSFGRFYAIYTITAPNAAATAYVRQCKTGNPLFYCRYSACHLLIPPSNFPKMIRIHIAGNALPRWLNHSCFPPSASFCPWSGHEKSTSGEMLSIVFGFTSQNVRYFEKLFSSCTNGQSVSTLLFFFSSSTCFLNFWKIFFCSSVTSPTR